MTITCVIITIILFRCAFEKLIIITKNGVNDLSLNKFRETFVIKIEIALIMILDFIEFDVVDLGITINELCDVIFVKGGFSKRRRSCVIAALKLRTTALIIARSITQSFD